MYFPLFKTQLIYQKRVNFSNWTLFTHQSILKTLVKITTLDVHYTNTSCLDMSAYNTLNKPTIFYRFINYWTYTTFTFLLKTKRIKTLVKFYKNNLFLERELREMFNINIEGGRDTRNLLLDYHYALNPMLSNFNVEGQEEVYLNIFNDKLEYVPTTYVEL